MSEFEYEEVAAQDPWQPWQEALDTSPVETVASLAAQYAQAYQPDPNEIAATVLAQVTQLQAIEEQAARDEEEAKILDRSLAAHFPDDYGKYAPEIGRVLAEDQELQQKFSSARDLQARADILAERIEEMREYDRLAKFRQIQGAPTGRLGL